MTETSPGVCKDCLVVDGCEHDTIPTEERDCECCELPGWSCVCCCQDCKEPVCECPLEKKIEPGGEKQTEAKRWKIINEEGEQEDYPSIEVGICCFCAEDCHPCSQACGSCMRNGPMFAAYF